jgi:hypothetical protein
VFSSEIVSSLRCRRRMAGARQHPDSRYCEAALGSPESLGRGMLPKGLPVNLGELPVSAEYWASVRPNPNSTRSPGKRALPTGSEQTLDEQQPVAKGDRRQQLRAAEQSYELIVPMKVENRRAPARGGHDTHWREGANRWMHRCSAT